MRARQFVALLRTRAKNNFTTPLAVYTTNAIHADIKMCNPTTSPNFRATIPNPLHPEPLAPLTPQICARAAPYDPLHHLSVSNPRHSFLSLSCSPMRATPAGRR